MAGLSDLKAALVQQLQKRDVTIQKITELYTSIPGFDSDKKSIFEQAFREVTRDRMNHDKDAYSNLVLLAIQCAEKNVCLHTLPFLLLGDVLDSVTLEQCKKVFAFMESQVHVWVAPSFYGAGKHLLLRMCNDILRRLSRSQNTVFCGRIQLFLVNLFPLSEKSALNLMSHFNLDNVTQFSKHATGNIDYNLYSKLWTLQDFFRLPVQCYSSEKWKKFTESLTDVMEAFASYKLEDVGGNRKQKVVSAAAIDDSHYFAKYLTSEKLMHLQLGDNHFRRHVLIQTLVVFDYLTSEVKFKGPNHVLSDAQQKWIQETTVKVLQLLEETPPDGSNFTANVKHILEREHNWISWKNDGCPSFIPENATTFNIPNRKRRAGDSVSTPLQAKKLDLGNDELSRLWNLNPDNLKACKAQNRIYVPEMTSFFEEALEQFDPEAQIEDEYKLVNKPNFTWRALRLLSRRSPHFFQGTQATTKTLPDYLTAVIQQTAKDSSSSSQ